MDEQKAEKRFVSVASGTQKESDKKELKDAKKKMIKRIEELKKTAKVQRTISAGAVFNTITLIHGSCAEEEVDAVVNAANKYLAAGGGICGVIFQKAGRSALQNACDEYQTPLGDGEAVITPAFGLKNAKYIIHAVGPDFGVTPKAYDRLCDAYYNSIKVLMENGLHSISFPLISSGIFGGNLRNPAKTSAEMCLKAVGWFLKNYPDYAVDVRLCAYSDTHYQLVKQVFDEAQQRGDNIKKE